jgi:tetratricopeptide (TPR) repeat protein
MQNSGPIPVDDSLKAATQALYAGRLDEAEASVRARLEEAPEDAEGYRLLGLVAYRRGQVEDSFKLLRRAIELDPQTRSARRQLVQALLAQNRMDEAEAEIEAGNAAYGGIDLGLCMLQADMNLRRGERDIAEAACRYALEMQPTLPRAHAILGMLQRDRGELVEAAMHYLAARQGPQPAPDPYLELALLLLVLGRAGDLMRLTPPAVAGQAYGEKAILAIACWLNNQIDHTRRFLAEAKALLAQVEADAPNRAMCESHGDYIALLLDWRAAHPSAYQGEASEMLFHVGDVHCLGAAHLLVAHGESKALLVPRLVPDLRAWHFVEDEASRPLAAFKATLASLPEGARIVLSCGELDLQQEAGILAYLRAHPQVPMEELVDRLLPAFVEKALALAAERRQRLIFQTPPARAAVTVFMKRGARAHFEATAKRFVQRLREAARAAGAPIVDVNAITADARGEPNRQYYFDTVHLRPQAFIDAYTRGLR